MFFVKGVILKIARVANPELKLAGGAIKLIMSDGDAVFKLQRAEMRDKQMQTDAVIVIKIAGEGIRSHAHRAGVAEQGKTHAGAVVLFQNGNAVFERTEPVTIASNRFIGHIGVGAIRWVMRADVPEFETTQRIKTTEII